MGHKVNPIGLRLGINRTWDSRWYSRDHYQDLLIEDLKIRDFLFKRQEIEALRKELAKRTTGDVHLNIVEIRKPEIDAKLVAENIAQQLERRVTFRRAMKRAVQSAMRLGAQGIRVSCQGRLGGAEIARGEWYREGRVPLHTLRADIDFGRATAFTPYGTNGVKVWVFKGEILEHDPMGHDKRLSETSSVRS